ncbi:hypothetical protein QBC42DRAFT_211892 [Cladorrhinum samala]|uniref:Large ribosomal subunit protein bL32m n=1 Tax=Cladorrhinum samala TaxID=585594 RepID=A0AAV9HEB6_9PEZI|nr:hypothetical protein QBC42DRAFT_211892 [Cladorrhinum samala]
MASMAAPAWRTGVAASLFPRLFLSTQSFAQRFSVPFLPASTLAVPLGVQLGLPSIPEILEGIWEGILKAVPKKKTSHMKKRHRQMAGKALQDVTSLCKCPACGETKRMHHLCPHCVSKLKGLMREEAKKGSEATAK